MLSLLNDSQTTIPLIIDGILLVVLLVFSIVGLVRGFLKSFIGLIGTILCFFVALYASKFLFGWLDGMFHWTDSLAKVYQDFFSTIPLLEVDVSTLTTIDAQNALANASIPLFLAKSILALVSKETFFPAGTMLSYLVSVSLASFTLSALSVLLLFTVLRLILLIITNLLHSAIDKVPVVGAVNRVLGLLFGLLEALILLYFIFMILDFFPMDTIKSTIDSTILCKFLHQYNLLSLIIQSVISFDWSVVS